MHIRSNRRAVQALALGLLMALIVFAFAAMPASAAEPPLTLAIDATPIAISAGESTNFQVALKNNGAQDRNGVLLGMTLEGPVDEVKPGIVTKDPNVSTKGVRRRGRAVFWQGDLPAGEGLVLN